MQTATLTLTNQRKLPYNLQNSLPPMYVQDIYLLEMMMPAPRWTRRFPFRALSGLDSFRID
jgi:hypothetical protein